jgi:hypothetical protein
MKIKKKYEGYINMVSVNNYGIADIHIDYYEKTENGLVGRTKTIFRTELMLNDKNEIIELLKLPSTRVKMKLEIEC